jgi:hypothetical protein
MTTPDADADGHVAGAARGPATLLEAVASLQAAGYAVEMTIAPGGSVRCGSCGRLVATGDVSIERAIRLEGASDPADEAIVHGIRCPSCSSLGLLVVRYGPSASIDEAEYLNATSHQHRPGPPG